MMHVTVRKAATSRSNKNESIGGAAIVVPPSFTAALYLLASLFVQCDV
jgi:hypothetical protein